MSCSNIQYIWSGGVAHWINSYFNLKGDKVLDKNNEIVVKVKEWVDAQYDEGRVTVITDEELEEVTLAIMKELNYVLEGEL